MKFYFACFRQDQKGQADKVQARFCDSVGLQTFEYLNIRNSEFSIYGFEASDFPANRFSGLTLVLSTMENHSAQQGDRPLAMLLSCVSLYP